MRGPCGRFVFSVLSAVLFGAVAPCLTAAPITWIGGNLNWADGTGVANWSPADEPDADDEAIFNTDNSVLLGTSNSIQRLTLSSGIDLNTNGQDLTIDGLAQLSGTSTNFIIGGIASSVQIDSVAINSGGNIELRGGGLVVVEESGNGLLDINAGGVFSGFGTVNLTDGLVMVATLVSNDGEILATSSPASANAAPPVGTLSITLSSGAARLDLDGSGNAGKVTVARNQTLDLNGTLSDEFSGTLNLFHKSTFDLSTAWTLDTGTITVDNGAIPAAGSTPAVSADSAVIAGGAFTQTGGTIAVTDSDGVLEFAAPFTMSGGTLNNNGIVVFSNGATIASGANLVMTGANASVGVDTDSTVLLNSTNIDLDGGNTLANRLIVNPNGMLTINVADYDTDAATNSYDGTITLLAGAIDINTGDAEFVMNGVLNMQFEAGEPNALWSGEPLDIGNDSGLSDAKINISGAGFSQINSQVDFNSDADVLIGSGATLVLNNTVDFQSVNGFSNAKFTGAGRLETNAAVNVLETTTLGMIGGTVDLDGSDSSGDLVKVDAPLTIRALSLADFGRTNAGGGITTMTVNGNTATGALTVQLDVATAEWTLAAGGVLNLINDATAETLLAGSDANLNGTVNVIGDVRSTARVDVGGTVNINTTGEAFRLAGGDSGAKPNTLAGGTINGPGLLGADTGKALHGFGTINAPVDFDDDSNLLADNGTLTINGAILDVKTLGTADADGILNIPAAWQTSGGSGNSIGEVVLKGGTLQGGAITNDNATGIQGAGTIASRVVNNTKLLANSGTLIAQTAANDNDWDGPAGTGQLEAIEKRTLELRDDAEFGFAGTVRATERGRVFTNGFALDFNPGSTLTLFNGTYESTHATNLGGGVNVTAGTGTIKTQGAVGVTIESTATVAIDGFLTLESQAARVQAGATFSGSGGVSIPAGSQLATDAGANINVSLGNEGSLRPGGDETIGQLSAKVFSQAATGKLLLELAGSAPTQFDRLSVSGAAALGGELNLDFDGSFVPTLGQSFEIMTALGGVTGSFSQIQAPGLPAGTSFFVDYRSTTVSVRLLNTAFIAAQLPLGDFNLDGVTNQTDYNIWKDTFNLNRGGDANGDGVTNAADYTLWRDGQTAVPSTSAAVPEPGAVAIVVGMLLVCHGSLSRARSKLARGVHGS